MAAKMAVYYKKYKTIFPETGKLQGFACKILILLIFEYIHHSCNIPVMQLMHYLEFDIFKMASRVVAEKFYKPMGATPIILACLVDL